MLAAGSNPSLRFLRESNKKVKGLELTETLKNYAQTGSEYTKILNQIIKQNRLMDFEPVKLENSSKKIELSQEFDFKLTTKVKSISLAKNLCEIFSL